MGKPDTSRHAPEEIDAYLQALPDDVRSALKRVRHIIREMAPDCTERVSYRVPIFRLRTDLVGLSAHSNHCALHVMSPALVKAMAEELKGVEVAGATIHFTAESPLPRNLIEQIVQKRMEESGLA